MTTQNAEAALIATSIVQCLPRGGKTRAEAALVSSFEMVPITGFVEYSQGVLDAVTNTIKAIGTGRWGSATTWGDFKNYYTDLQPIKWTAPVLDTGSVDYFNLNIAAEFDGLLNYQVYVSATGEFDGEEELYVIEEGNFNVPAFYGRYVRVTATVQGRSLNRFTIETNRVKSITRLPNVNTALLAGTVGNRQLALPQAVSQIYDINIEPQAATAYAVNLYVSDTATSQILIPVIRSKNSTTPTIGLFGIDNDPRDGIVDITITSLARMVMTGGNLIVVE